MPIDDGETDLRSSTKPPPPAATVEPFPIDRFKEWLADLKINTKDYGLQPFKMLGTQRYVLDEITQGLLEGVSTFVILKARQLGMSTFFLALDLFWALEHSGLAGTFATHDEQSAATFRNTLQTFLLHLPRAKRMKPKGDNKLMLVLPNGSSFRYLVAGTRAKTSSSTLGKGGASNYLHATEVAFWGNAEEDLAELSAGMSTRYPHRLEIYESTANGYNEFEEMWINAKGSPTTRTIFVGWWRNELYSIPQNHPWFRHYMPNGMDTPLKIEERKQCTEVRKLYGFEVSKEQIAWYRYYLTEKLKDDQDKMNEQHPWTEDDAFVATGARFYSNESLTHAMKAARRMPFRSYNYVFSDRWQDLQVVETKNPRRAMLKVWEPPDSQGTYVVGDDPSFGSSETADRNVIHVARCYADCLVQVAEFCSAEAASYHNAWVLAHLCGWYRDVMVNLEITGPGTAVWKELTDLRTEVNSGRLDGVDASSSDIQRCLSNIRVYLHRRPDHPGARGLAHHWRTTHETKRVLMNVHRDSFSLGRHIIRGLECLEEMKAVVQDGDWIGAEGRAKDDRAVAAALANWAWKQWVQVRLRNMGLTYQAAQKQAVVGPPKQVERIAIDYLRQAKILLPGQTLDRGE